MRTVSASWRTLVPYTHPLLSRVDSYLDGQVLATQVPIVSGRIQYDDSGVVKRRLTISVPARDSTRRWDPAGQPLHPLGVYGQRLHVATGIGYPNGGTELLDHGWYLITKWQRDEAGGTVEVEAVDLAQLLQDDRLTKPDSPPASSTFHSEFTRLVAGILPVDLTGAPANRAIGNTSLVYDRDRDKALQDLCDAWPARWYVNDAGAVCPAPVYPLVNDTTPADVILNDGAAGVVVTRARQGERGALYNVMVVDGKAGDDGTAGPHAEASITAATSPIRVSGPYGRVTRFFASDLITTTPQAQASANSLLVTFATAGRAETATMVPDPSVQLGDVARIYTKDGDRYTGRVSTLDVPLTPGEAPMTIGIAMVPAGVIEGERAGGV